MQLPSSKSFFVQKNNPFNYDNGRFSTYFFVYLYFSTPEFPLSVEDKCAFSQKSIQLTYLFSRKNDCVL